MKYAVLLILFNLVATTIIHSQVNMPDDRQHKAIVSLIDQYSLAREKKDTILLKKILTVDIDQLVSTGEWRNGIDVAVAGMLKSSAASPGTRTLTVDKIKMLSADIAIADCRYDVQNADGTPRNMWSSFIVVAKKGIWKISAIRNMMPAAQP